MNTNNKDYELIARMLDGEEVDLTEAQQALADEIAADTEAVGRALDVQLPGGTLHRINASIRQGHTGRRPARLWFRWAGAAAAVAAAVIVAAVLFWPAGPDGNGKKGPDPFDPANGEPFIYNDDDLDICVDAFSDESADARAALLLDEDFSTELAMASFEQEMEELMLDENGLDFWPEQDSGETPL